MSKGTALTTGSLGALNASLDVPVDSYGLLSIDLSGTFSGTITVTVSLDGATFRAIPVTSSVGVVDAGGTATAAGLYTLSVIGAKTARIKMTSYASGAAVVAAGASEAPGFNQASSIIEARSYGVLADGATDDTAAWGLALAAAAAGGGAVAVPAGTSVVTGLTVPAGVWLQGRGVGSVLKLKSGSNKHVVNLAGALARISDVRILGNSVGQTSGTFAGVAFTADDCSADSVRVEDAYKYGFYAPNVNRPAIRNCTVIDSLYIGIYVETTGAVDISDPVISGNRVDRSSLAAATISEGGIKVHGAAGKVVHRPRITNNHVEMPTSPVAAAAVAIETFGGVKRSVISGNTTSGGSIGISCDTSPSCSVSGNSVVGASLYGIEIVTSDNAAVVANTVDGASLTTRGIAVNGSVLSSKAVAITGNTVTACAAYGVRSQGAAQITISGNTVQLTGSAGIYVSGATYAAVTGNVVDDPALTMNDGIFFDGCTWLTCTGNAISGVDNNGVLIFATTAITIRAFVFANAIDISGGSSVSTNLSGGAVMSSESMVWGNSDGALTLLNQASNVRVVTKAGTPEGSIVAGIGSLCVRTDGGAVTTLYVKESGVGNTGWVAK